MVALRIFYRVAPSFHFLPSTQKSKYSHFPEKGISLVIHRKEVITVERVWIFATINNLENKVALLLLKEKKSRLEKTSLKHDVKVRSGKQRQQG